MRNGGIHAHRSKTVAFVDGQNLFHTARESFGYVHPNYDVKALAEALCRLKGRRLIQTRFYTGITDLRDNAFWHHFWSANWIPIDRKLYESCLDPRDYRKTIPIGKPAGSGGLA